MAVKAAARPKRPKRPRRPRRPPRGVLSEDAQAVLDDALEGMRTLKHTDRVAAYVGLGSALRFVHGGQLVV